MREELFDSILSQVRKNAEIWKLKEKILSIFPPQQYH
jgi:hypothetical protein